MSQCLLRRALYNRRRTFVIHPIETRYTDILFKDMCVAKNALTFEFAIFHRWETNDIYLRQLRSVLFDVCRMALKIL